MITASMMARINSSFRIYVLLKDKIYSVGSSIPREEAHRDFAEEVGAFEVVLVQLNRQLFARLAPLRKEANANVPKQLFELFAFIRASLTTALHRVQQEGLSKCFVQDARAKAGTTERAILGAVGNRGLQASAVEELAVAHLRDLISLF
jgi:hypothetical protein